MMAQDFQDLSGRVISVQRLWPLGSGGRGRFLEWMAGLEWLEGESA